MLKKPYYQEDGISIYHGDCQELLATLGKFDLLLTDPPYGINAPKQKMGSGQQKFYRGNLDWDSMIPNLAPIIKICDWQCIWGGNYFTHQLPANNHWLIWDKNNANRSFSEAELAWTNFGCQTRIKTHHRGNEKKQHPTMKPLAVMRWCIKLAPKANTIFDPFMGSGTTLLAAKLDGLNCTGCDLEERYCEIAADRLRQGVLF